MSKASKPTKRVLKRRRTIAARRRDRRETPIGRLFDDGATNNEHTRKRIQWLAEERKLPPEDVAKAMKLSTYEIGRFAKKYRVSYDWLLYGDLKGLQRMTQERTTRRSMSSTVVMENGV
jgi:hypothetical protein